MEANEVTGGAAQVPVPACCSRMLLVAASHRGSRVLRFDANLGRSCPIQHSGEA